MEQSGEKPAKEKPKLRDRKIVKAIKGIVNERVMGAVGAAGIAIGAGAYTGNQESLRDYQGDVEGGVRHTREFFGWEHAPNKDELTPVIVEKLGEKPETNFDIFYPWAHEGEKLEGIMKVQEARAELDKYNGPEVAKRVAQYEDLIRKSCEEYGVPSDLCIGMVMVESKGDPKAESSVGAKGLTQVMAELAPHIGLSTYNEEGIDEREIPEKILPATAKELKKLHEKEGTWAGAVQIWHMGEPQYQDFKREVLAKRGKIIPDPTTEAETHEEADEMIRINRLATIANEMAPYRVFKDPDILAQIQGTEWNGTEDYLPYILAGIDKYYQEKDLP